MSEQLDQMSRQLDQMSRQLYQALTILATMQQESEQLARANIKTVRTLKIAQLLAKADATRRKMEAELDAAKSAWVAAILSLCAAISVTESEEGMAALEAKLDNLAGVLSEVSADVQSIHSRARDFDP